MRIQYNKVGNKPVGGYVSGYQVHTAVYFCPHCGAEIYSQWNVQRHEVQDAAREAQRFAALQNCLQCGQSLRHEKGYFMQVYSFENSFFKTDLCCFNNWTGTPGKYHFESYKLDSVYQFLAKEREAAEKAELEKKIQTLVKPLEREIVAPASPQAVAAIKESPLSLQTYLQQLVRLESNIYALTKRLGSLYQQRQISFREAADIKYGLAEGIRQKSRAAAKAIPSYRQAVESAQNQPLPAVSVPLPKKPTPPVPPLEPYLETPGFFNKKRVLAENAEKTARYQQELTVYRQKQADYELALENYHRRVSWCIDEEARQKEANRQRHEAAVRKAQEALDAAQANYDRLQSEEATRIAEVMAKPVAVDYGISLLDQEIGEAERLLKELYSARNRLYGYNVVFGKYRNLVALSTFCEYLMTGRCEALEGANGAYNLYESECRADMIISQLSTVIASLEQIKESQYMIYSELQQIRSDLADLNSTMHSALTSIQNIDRNTGHMSKTMDQIAEHTAVIAHNSAVTAYYSKVSAELTNALGYMVALK